MLQQSPGLKKALPERTDGFDRTSHSSCLALLSRWRLRSGPDRCGRGHRRASVARPEALGRPRLPDARVEFDERTLDLIDADKDGRIRAPEILAAVDWAVGLLRNSDDLVAGRTSLPLSAINDATPQGKAILASARTILSMLGRAEAAEISLQDTVEVETALNRTDFNGGGIVPAEAAADAETRRAMVEIIDCLGAENDRSGLCGARRANRG